MANMNLFDEYPILVDRVLAKTIGLNEAIVLQQVHYWIQINKRNGKNFYDGRYWTFGSAKKWHKENFEFLSLNTVKRTFKKLEERKVLIVGNFNKRAYDRTKWYTINYELLDSLKPCNYSLTQNGSMESTKMGQCINSKWVNGEYQNELMESIKMGQPIQENNKEINKEINTTQEVCALSPKELEIKALLKDKFKDTYTEEYATRVINLVKDKNETLEGFKEKLEMALDRNIQNKNGYLLKAIQDNYKKPKRNTNKNGFSNFKETVGGYSETDLNTLIAASQGSKFGEL